MDSAEVARWKRLRRRELLAARAVISADAHAQASEQIFARVQQIVEQRRPDVVGLYLPIRGEPDPMPWLHHYCAVGGRVALPVVEGSELCFHAWSPGEALQDGPLGTRGPRAAGPRVPEMIVAPLTGFDRNGFRLGYGGGFYDRLLAGDPRPYAVGVGFSLSEVASIHPQPYDRPMDAIATENELLLPGSVDADIP